MQTPWDPSQESQQLSLGLVWKASHAINDNNYQRPKINRPLETKLTYQELQDIFAFLSQRKFSSNSGYPRPWWTHLNSVQLRPIHLLEFGPQSTSYWRRNQILAPTYVHFTRIPKTIATINFSWQTKNWSHNRCYKIFLIVFMTENWKQIKIPSFLF